MERIACLFVSKYPAIFRYINGKLRLNRDIDKFALPPAHNASLRHIDQDTNLAKPAGKLGLGRTE